MGGYKERRKIKESGAEGREEDEGGGGDKGSGCFNLKQKPFRLSFFFE